MRFTVSYSITMSVALCVLPFGALSLTDSDGPVTQPTPFRSRQHLQVECGISALPKRVRAHLIKDRPLITRIEGLSGGARQQNRCEGQIPKNGRFKLPSSWKDLIPLQATRAEVERVLGKPKSSAGSRQIYENDTERVDVVYSTGRCEAVAGRWNVAPSVAILVVVYPNKSLFLDDVIFDKQKFVRQIRAHPEDWVTYRNKEDGIEIDTINYGRNAEAVRRFSFGPKAKDSNLRCNKDGAPTPLRL